MKKGLINWTPQQFRNLNRDILFFDEFNYDSNLTALGIGSFMSFSDFMTELYKSQIKEITDF